MSYIPLKDLGVSERKPRFNNTTHNAIFYTLHVISITLFTILYFTRSADTSTTINWYNYDEKTDTLHIDAKTVVIGIKSLERTLGSSEKIKPKLVVHGTVHSTEIDVEKDVIFRGDTKLIHGKDGKDGLQGLPGNDGQDGPQGLPGKDGRDGTQGLPGNDGQDGPQGLSGKDGRDGKDGTQGLPGKDGRDGKDGTQGLPGKDGLQGLQGLPGKDGKDGLQGLSGKDGNDGQDGPQGLPGNDGLQGLPGKDGKDGLQGLPGKDGKDGPQGLPGNDGKDGLQGLPGQDASNEWWKYDHDNGILHILSNVTTMATLDVSKDAFVHGMMTTSDLDVSAPQHEPMNLKP